MSYGVGIITQSGAGTLTASGSSSTIVPTLPTNLTPRCLIVAVGYVTGQDCTLAADNGDGWVFLNSVYDSVNSFGLFIAAFVLTHRSVFTPAGIRLPGAAAYTVQTYSFAKAGINTNASIPTFDFDIKSASRSAPFIQTASSTTITAPEIYPNCSQFFDVVGSGYNNGGTTTTLGNFTPTNSLNEVFDTGQVSPPHGVSLSATSANVAPINGNVLRTSTSATLAVAKTNRVCLRACIPITGNIIAAGSRRRMTRARLGG